MIKLLLLSLLVMQIFGKHIEKSQIKEDEGSGEASKRVIMQGTLWCRMGNKAEDDEALGTYADVDICCRDHDHCDKNVAAFAKKYNYRNWRPYTVSDCECDQKFYDCLKAANEHKLAAKIVGKLFFNILRIPCLKFNADGTTATKGYTAKFK